MSIIFAPPILGPEMAAPILWVPGMFGFFRLESPHAHKIRRFGGGGVLKGGAGNPHLIFMAAWGFSDEHQNFYANKAKTEDAPLSE